MATIQYSDLDIKERVGAGGFAAVCKGIWKSKNMTVAIKTFPAVIPTTELEILKLVDHPNLLRFYGTVEMPLSFWIVTEYMEQGALFDFLHKNEFHSDRNLKWARQIAAGMKYLHFDVPGQVVIHGDLKSKNVLVAADNTVKICDFGSSKLRLQLPEISVHTTTKVHGTPRWMSPEVLQSQTISKQCDVYSYGIVLWELLTHKLPFEDVSNYAVTKKVVEDKERPPIPEDCLPSLANLLEKCWYANPELRPKFTEIVLNLEHLPCMIMTKELPSQTQTTYQVKGPEDGPSLVVLHEETDYFQSSDKLERERAEKQEKKREESCSESGQQIQLPPQPASLASATSGHQCYSAIYDYTAIEENEVSFVKGDIIVDTKVLNDLWIVGRVQCTGKYGLLPSNYVEPLSPSEVTPHPEQYIPLSRKDESLESESSSMSEAIEVYDDPQTLSYQPESPAEADKSQLYEDTQPIWAISREEVELLDDELGKGAWGIVTKACFRGEIVAAKRLHETLSEDNPKFLYKAIRRELDIASNLRHPNLVLFLGAVIQGNLRELIILIELMDSSLRDVLAEDKLSRSQIKSFSIDVARALNYLHSCKPQPLIHRDVSSANVLLLRLGPDYWKAKLSDYGSLQAINLACTLSPGNPVYAAPEALRGGKQSCKMDTYSFGILLIEMVSCHLPSLQQRAMLLEEIKWQEMHLLIETCIQAHPDGRPEMQEIIKSLEHMPEKQTVQQHINNYVEMTWFLPSLTRSEAVEKLASEGEEGNFLVRLSSSGEENKYSLSVLHQKKVYHYRIRQNPSTEFYIDENINFQSLEEMIEFYKQSQGGLCTKLCEYTAATPESLKDQSSLTDTEWEISEAELSLGPQIAKGQCGYVVAGMWKGLDVAIRVTKQDSLDETGLQFIGNAIDYLKKFHHVNLVRFYGICTQEGPLLIVTELMPRGPLDNYIKQHQELLDRNDVLLDMSIQICSALKFLETKEIFHGDLAARNCQVGERNVVKVADYSLSLYTSPRKPSRTVVSVRWAAPEIIVQTPKFTTKSDVWSFGVVMWELWSGAQTPYLDLRNSMVKGKLLAGHRMEKPESCPEEVYSLMHNCWNLNAPKRPSFAHLHEELSSLNAREEYGELQKPVTQLPPTKKSTSTGKLYYEGLETSKSEVTLSGNQLGKGTCGYMVAGTWKNVDVAIRVTNEKAMTEDGLHFLEEAINILMEFQHENLLKLYGICSQEGPVLYIITELLTRGCLKAYLNDHRVVVEKVEVLLDMATQVCSAMKFLESKKIVHKDVATRNCLVGDRNVIKLADFSLPLFISERTTSSNCVPIRWTAPEILKGGQYSIKSDIWSFGVLLWELWTAAQEPYSGLHNHRVADLVIAGHRLEKPEHCPQQVYELMKSCWMADAEQRSSFAALHDDLTSLGTPDDIFGMVAGFKRTFSKSVPKHSSVAVLYDSALEIPKSQLKFGKELTSGKYGYMMSGWWKGREVAVRVANDNSLTENGLQFIEEAVSSMKKFEHPNLLKLYGLCTRQGALFVVTELLQQQGILLNYIKQQQNIMENEGVILDFAIQICAAMKFLEAKGIIHKDLAARNCLIGENNVVKVTDFSLTIFTSDRKPVKTQFPIKWSAPETLTDGSHSTKSDVWSYGILLWEIWSGGMQPYPDFQLQETAEQVLAGYRLIKPQLCPQAVYNLMQQCWQMNPGGRPSFTMLHEELVHLKNPAEDIYEEIPDTPPAGILADKDEEERKRLEREKLEKERKRREEAHLRNRQRGIRTYRQFGLTNDSRPLFVVEVLLDQPKKKDILGVTTGERVFVLLRNHPNLPEGLCLVEKEDGTIGYVKKSITKQVVCSNTQTEQPTPFSKANSGDECYSVYKYNVAGGDIEDPYGEVDYVSNVQKSKSNQSMMQKQQSAPSPKVVSHQQRYSALYDYNARDYNEVSFIKGDIIIVVGSFGEAWMKGHVQRTGKNGLVPSNYVKKI